MLENGAIKELQIGARKITNRENFRDFKSEQKDYISVRDFKSGQKDFKLEQRLQIGAREISNRGRVYKFQSKSTFIADKRGILFEKLETLTCSN